MRHSDLDGIDGDRYGMRVREIPTFSYALPKGGQMSRVSIPGVGVFERIVLDGDGSQSVLYREVTAFRPPVGKSLIFPLVVSVFSFALGVLIGILL